MEIADAAIAPATSVAEVKAASMLVVLAKRESSVRSTVNFLERRGFAAKYVATLNEAVELFSKKEANMLLLSMNFSHPKVEMLAALMNQSFKIETIVYAEESDRKTSNRLSNSKSKHVLFGPVSGPVVMMKIRQIDREMSGEGDDAAASGDKRVMSSKEDEGDIKIGGRKGSNEDTVVLNGRADAKAKSSFDNAMKSLTDGTEAESDSTDSLSRSGETYIQRGERSKMKSAGGDAADADDSEALSEEAQAMRAGLDRGLMEAPPGARGRLIMPNSFRKTRAEMDSSKAEELPALTAYEVAAENLRRAENEKAVEAVKMKAERESAEASKKAEREAEIAQAKSEREALAAKQREEREATAVKMKADREAAGVKAKADREAATASKKAEREAADVESKAANARAQVEKQTAEARENEAAAALAREERARAERSTAAADAVARNSEERTGDAPETATRTQESQPLAASSNGAGAEKEAASGKETRLNETASSSSLMAGAGATAIDQLLTEAEKLALTIEEKVRRCLHESLAIVAGSAPSGETHQLTEHAQAALVSLRTSQLNCAFVVSMSYAKQTANELFHRMEIAFFSLLRDHGVEFENEQIHSIFLDNMSIVREAFAASEFSVITQTNEIEMGAAKVYVTNPVAKTEIYEENMHSINLRDLPLGSPVTFNLFLHFKQNQKFLRYLKIGSVISEAQVNRLESRHAFGLVETGEVEAYRRHFAAHAIHALKKPAA